MVLDYISNVAGAIKNKKVDSDVVFWGGTRKATVLMVVQDYHWPRIWVQWVCLYRLS
ncbi:phage holin family protein [Paenibacillus sp. Aloe-11]|uniref:phage holin family protein n=1 Tax=Paenibacillus sp. Aloe-11 TaxID=1050222 RepID=UPI001E40C9A3|nr:phage holin family protein [Paenibacillus sp. Aloe-11]